MCGRPTSRITRGTVGSIASCRPLTPSAATSTSYPSRRNPRESGSLMARSSSTSKIRDPDTAVMLAAGATTPTNRVPALKLS